MSALKTRSRKKIESEVNEPCTLNQDVKNIFLTLHAKSQSNSAWKVK